MTEGTGIAGLAGSLAEKLARDVRCVCKQQQTVSASVANSEYLSAWSCARSVGEGDARFEHKQRQTGVTYWAGCAACCGDGCFRGHRWGC